MPLFTPESLSSCTSCNNKLKIALCINEAIRLNFLQFTIAVNLWLKYQVTILCEFLPQNHGR